MRPGTFLFMCKLPVQAAPEGAVKAEALRWENRRLAEAKEKLEGLTRDQQRRIIQLEEALSDLKSTPARRSNSLSHAGSCTSDTGSPSRKVTFVSLGLLQMTLRASHVKLTLGRLSSWFVLTRAESSGYLLEVLVC